MTELRVKGVSFSFSRFLALKSVDLSIRPGEVVGILGENGAGKSTLLNLLSGTLRPTEGSISVEGHPFDVRNYHEANLRGIWRIFQDPAVIPSLRVFENLFLGHESRFLRHGLIDKRTMIRLATKLVADMQLDVDVRDQMHKYDFATRQALEVGRATLLPEILGLSAGYVLFDEPTTGLTRGEVIALLQRMRDLKAAGAGVTFVSHRLQEIFDVCDRVIVLKDGAIAGSGDIGEFDEDKLHRLMVGRDVTALSSIREHAPADGEPLLTVKGLGKLSNISSGSGLRRADVSDVSFTLNSGEIVGIGGLMGSGKNQLIRMIAGDIRADLGTVQVEGANLSGDIRKRKQLSVAFVSGDRAYESVIGRQSVRSNISLPSGHSGALGFSNRFGFWRTTSEKNVAREMIRELAIKADPDQNVGALSGGNQQKVALARWIHRQPKVLLIENPTAGVDVGAKVEIYRLLAKLADKGACILYVSDDLPELISLSDRILIMRDGRVAADIDNRGAPPTEHELVAAMIGRAQAHAL